MVICRFEPIAAADHIIGSTIGYRVKCPDKQVQMISPDYQENFNRLIFLSPLGLFPQKFGAE